MHSTPLHPKRKISFFSGWQQVSHSLGQPIEVILAKAALPPELVRQEHAELTKEQFFRFWHTLIEGRTLRQIADWFLGIVSDAMMAPYVAALCSSNLHAGLLRLAAYKPLLAPMQLLMKPCRGGHAVIIDWGATDVPASFAFAELCALRNLAERGTGRAVTPLWATVPGAEGLAGDAAREIMGVAVKPGPNIQIAFAGADLEAAFTTANPLTLKFLNDTLQQQLNGLSGCSSDKLKFVIKRLLMDQRGTLEEAAAEMACSPRTLQRQLSDEGTSFKQVLDETRRDLACLYLSKIRFSPKETSFMLGYSEFSAFHRAFRRWTGQSPAAYAKTHATPQPPTRPDLLKPGHKTLAAAAI